MSKLPLSLELLPVPPPLEPPPEPVSSSIVEPSNEVSFKGSKMRITSESQGFSKYGAEGVCLSHNQETETLQLMIGDSKIGMVNVRLSECVLISPDWIKPIQWKQLTLSRERKFNLLVMSNLISEDPNPEVPAEPFELITESIIKKGLLDQHLSYGSELLTTWHWASIRRSRNIRIVSPVLLEKLWRIHEAELNNGELQAGEQTEKTVLLNALLKNRAGSEALNRFEMSYY
jgi:hypothetical protein